jgi:hypothetical protein
MHNFLLNVLSETFSSVSEVMGHLRNSSYMGRIPFTINTVLVPGMRHVTRKLAGAGRSGMVCFT